MSRSPRSFFNVESGARQPKEWNNPVLSYSPHQGFPMSSSTARTLADIVLEIRDLRPTEEMNMARQHNTAVIGYGMSAKVFHIPLITVVPAFKLYAVVQRNPKADDDAEKDHPGIKSFRSTEEMVRDSAIEVVVVTTTPQTHFELTKMALEHGKHVIVEKPFAPTSKECDELIAIAKKHQRLLTVYQNRRWDSDFLTVSELYKEDTLGRIVEFETHFDRHRPEVPPTGGWKTKALPGGGAIYDLGTHLIDQVVVLFGMPSRITGFVGSHRANNPGGYEDSFIVLMHYTGMVATIKATVVSPEVEQLRYWVRGEKGSFVKYHMDVQEDHLKAGKKPGDTGFGIENGKSHGFLTTTKDGQPSREVCQLNEPLTYSTFYSGFATALAGQGEVPVTPETASAVIRLIELARRSSEQERTLQV